mmetsp:Transcript_82887/g.243014  ORF Transcript_82887/g.243014 Transcript_82887/m.243014 type:complete len:400 (-) Transcript_82887:94-1293(-)
MAVVGPKQSREADARFMRQALQLSEQGRRATAPNPWVGVVIVAGDGETVLGQGFHKGPGQPHAEVEAFRDASAHGIDDFTQATLYTTLEPCHRGPGKRTPPCDELLVSKKIRRCVVGHVDPDPKFGGAGVEFLRSSGITVDVGTEEEEVRSSLRAYFHHRQTGLPYVVVKLATSLDGRIACADRTSQWITKAAARQDAHRLRADSQAIMVGSGTALQDRPSLTVRLPEETGLRSQPLRVVLDTRGRVLEGPLLDAALAPTLIFTCESLCNPEAYTKWQESGVEYCNVPLDADTAASDTERLDLRAVLRELAGRGVLQLMVEGGAVLHGALLRAGLCEELRVYLGATLLGSTGLPWAQTELTKTIGEAQFWKLRAVRKLDDDVCLEYERPVKQPEESGSA